MDARLAFLLGLAGLFQIALFAHTGRFVVPRWKAYGKIGFYMLITWILADSLGWWSVVWILGHPALDITAHAVWCRNHGIDWVTCEPRAKYLRLRPWAGPDQVLGSEPPLVTTRFESPPRR